MGSCGKEEEDLVRNSKEGEDNLGSGKEEDDLGDGNKKAVAGG